MNRQRVLCAAMAVLLTVAAAVRADVALPGIFADNMVVQRDAKLTVWGTAAAGEQIQVAFAKQTAKATTDAEGCWKLTLDPVPAGGPHTMTVTGKNTIELKNIQVGEVWLCSGQSNMAMTVGGVLNAQQEIAAAELPKIRHFRVAPAPTPEPQANCQGAWTVCSPATARGFSATAFFFARALHKHLGVPIGLINASIGGTPIEAWTPRQALEAEPALKPLLEPWDEKAKAFDPEKAKKNHETQLAAWKEAVAKVRAAGKRLPRRPRLQDPRRSSQAPAALYNGMIAPIAPFAIRGAIWYQGERNCRFGTAYLYRTMLPVMIRAWRLRWGQGDFPFLYVQLPNWQGHNPAVPDWAVMRESMLLTLATPKTGMAVTIDVGDPKNIHPKNKQAVGQRLALAARAVAYGETLVWSGPLYESMKVEGGKVRIRFRHVGEGLAARGGPLQGFTVAGKDRKFVPATAAIDGETVVVSSAQVAAPVAVRYAWANNPVCNLANKAGLPASPFRTDAWPMPGQPGK